MSYFTVERNGNCWEHVTLQDRDGVNNFADFTNMTYDDIKFDDRLDEFVMAIMEATNEISSSDDDNTIVTLIGDDDIFIWSIIMSPGEDDNIIYNLVDWKSDGKSYRYVPENNA